MIPSPYTITYTAIKLPCDVLACCLFNILKASKKYFAKTIINFSPVEKER